MEDAKFIVNMQSAAFAMHAKNSEEIFRITADGQVIVNPRYTVDEAARAFWSAVREIAPVPQFAVDFRAGGIQ